MATPAAPIATGPRHEPSAAARFVKALFLLVRWAIDLFLIGFGAMMAAAGQWITAVVCLALLAWRIARRKRWLPAWLQFSWPTAIVFLLVVVLPAAVACWMLYLGVFGILKGHASQSWPTVYGRIVASRVQVTMMTERVGSSNVYRKLPHFSAQVHYRYRVGDKTYTGDRVSFNVMPNCLAPGPARRIVGRYPQGKQVPVHYNPNDPAEATLETGVAWPSMLAVIALSLAVAVILPGSWIRWRLRKKAAAGKEGRPAPAAGS